MNTDDRPGGEAGDAGGGESSGADADANPSAHGAATAPTAVLDGPAPDDEDPASRGEDPDPDGDGLPEAEAAPLPGSVSEETEATGAATASTDAGPAPTLPTAPAPAAALSWVDVEHVSVAASGPIPLPTTSRALLADAPRRSLLRPGVLVPIASLLLVAVAYGATVAAWPLTAIQPVATAVKFQPVAAPAAAVAWPDAGSAAVGIEGVGTIASSEQKAPMASITKLVTVLASFDKLPMKVGEQGRTFDFTRSDSNDYESYLRNDESALDVPVGGSLTQYQLLEGILLGSANNYADRLAREVWGSDSDYATAANLWLQQHDLTEITVVNPSGFQFDNVASPRALIELGKIAEHNPVIAEIVKKKSVDLPGAGVVENTNGLIGDPGIVGIKTGTIGDGDQTRYNLLSAKDVLEGATVVRIYTAVLGETSDETRVDASRKLYADVESALKDQPQTVTKGTTLGTVDTAWGETTQVVATEDARVVLWNGSAASTTTTFALGREWKAGSKAGALTLKGPLDSATVPLTLRTELKGPGFWWRFTHPLQLFGLTK